MQPHFTAAPIPVARPRIGLLGSVEFWGSTSEAICRAIGVSVAQAGVVLVTGGMTGVAETAAKAALQYDANASVYSLLPTMCPPLPYGVTIPCGRDMAERRQILGRCEPENIFSY